ncbi:fatty-acyl-CoA synthase/long-chain acyl-CoA synthetase [Roseovarius nanhaiticus]|uniref:Fatty-acyl-CoA synthase/long-chain acyl-CoA synthetase n=1 Tax=Roseovarius nanhaiticus TaxID=573024 RepID=A0A1N7FJG9_9RHOB|nr:acyl-CoA synthetase [Roseovarius nanhaiticus]SEK53034.1 fatty-acyl-CoA synthase/long-chain acyl-CoA synthetase [Roseovarius nanhaiticus]SIS00512.1 fatty-acyl-CoA synthase/long-chain acyl-CoA synthetase [Roseovarius nanhaiticus]
MTFAVRQDALDIQEEMPWSARDVPKTIHAMLAATARAHPERPAISYQLTAGARDPAKTLSWAEFHADVCRAANLFRSLGVRESDAVALVLPNSLETASATLGAMIAGIVAPINPLLEPEQIAALLRETGARVVVTLKAFPKTDISAKTAEAVRHAPKVGTVLEIDLNRYLSFPKSWIVPFIRPRDTSTHRADVLDYAAETARQPSELNFEETAEDRVAAYFHTGGTTGMPKMAQHRYSGMVYNGWLGATLLFDETDVLMCPLPLFHVFACHVVLMSALKSGAHVILPTPAGYRGEGVVANFWKLCERWGVTFVITVPTAVAALMQRKVDADISRVKNAFSGSAPMPLELFKRFESATGMKVIEGYGLTEVTCLVSCNPPEGAKKVGSVGIPLPYTDVRIIHATDDGPMTCGPDEVGEICISNPGVAVGATYTDPARNAQLFHGDYLRTGDLGRIDADGYLWITGRAKDLIIRGGHNIDPADIEEALMAHPAVAGAGAIGQPDAHAGELPCAYVELVEGGEASAEELLEHCRQRVRERAAIPKHIEVLEELPKTAVGKVFKPDLRKRAITRVYDAALETAGSSARVAQVVDDKKRGLVAQIDGDRKDAKVAKTLGEFTRPWEWADGAQETSGKETRE